MPIPKTRRAYFVLLSALWLFGEVAPHGSPQASPDATPAFQVIAAFEQKPQNPAGRLLEVKPGVFLGVATNGGAFSQGAVYVLFRTGGNVWSTRTIHSFSGTDGRNPKAGLVRGRDGNFYGTTSTGGAHYMGTVFRMTPLGAVTTLHSFAGLDGEEPWAPLVLANDGTLWGTTYRGGTAPGSGTGTIFKITENGSLTRMHIFGPSYVDGVFPTAGLFQASDGAFYGMTPSGGDSGVGDHEGVVFRITPAGDYTVLHRFDLHEPFGGKPLGEIVEGADGNFYGTTNGGGGLDGQGVVFKMTPDGAMTNLHTFGWFEGWRPQTGLVQASDGALYGTTSGFGQEAPNNSGSIFRIDSSGNYATVAMLGAPFGTAPSELIQASDGLLFGTTTTGEIPPLPELYVAGFGAAFSLPTTGPATRLVTFSSDRPHTLTSRLIEVAPGELYGTSCGGGLYNHGTVFKLSAAGLQTLHSFEGAEGFDGKCPVAGLTLGPDGKTLYGTTFWGGRPGDSASEGTVFKTTLDGELTVLHHFRYDDYDEGELGKRPAGELAVGADGNLYGTASGYWGGSNGTIFRISASDGTVTFVHRFFFPSDGALPFFGLIAATDGNLYGTTLDNREQGVEGGGIFRASPSGGLTIIHAFDSHFVGEPAISIMQASDGNLYGAHSSGPLGAGAIFKSSLAGAVTMLHSFNVADGFNPTGRLFESTDGFYGTTFGSEDGRGGFGTVFTMNPAGTVTTLHRFSKSDGANPYAGVIRISDGSLFGTTLRGGPGGGGVIYRVRP
jgi:uncharacterized repeat protein (TIGR03803 family)